MFNYTSSTLYIGGARESKSRITIYFAMWLLSISPSNLPLTSQRKGGYRLRAKWKQKTLFLDIWGQRPRSWGLEHNSILPYVWWFWDLNPRWMQLPSGVLLHALCTRSSQPSGVDAMMLKKEKAWAVQYAQSHTGRTCSAKPLLKRNYGSYGFFCFHSPLLSTSLTLVTFSHLSVSFLH